LAHRGACPVFRAESGIAGLRAAGWRFPWRAARRCDIVAASMPPDPDRPPDLAPARASPQPYRPIAVGFVLLALPLWIGVFLAASAAGAWANGIAAAVMTLLGVALLRLRV